jgi:integrase
MGEIVGKYHLFQAPNGVYYYWFWAAEKQIKKSTKRKKLRGPDGAQEFVEALERRDAEAAALQPVRRVLFKEVAAPMFLSGAAHLARRAEHDDPIKEHTRRQHRRNLERLIAWFGDVPLDEITEDRIEDKLSGIVEPTALETEEETKDREAIRAKSSSWKNLHLYTLKIVFREAKRRRLVASLPALEPFKRRSRRQSTLTDEELDVLFPACPGLLEIIWRNQTPKSREYDPPGAGLMFGALFALAVSAGLRPGEARGAWLDQYLPDFKTFVVNRALDDQGVLGLPKEGKEENPRIRVAPLPDKTLQILDWYLKIRGKTPGYLFAYRVRPIGSGYLDDRWERGLAAAGISTEGRRLTPHALRYTYNTRMKRRLPPDILRTIVGHLSEDMSERYDNPAIVQLIQDLAPYQAVVNGFWEQRTALPGRAALIG